MDTFFEIIVENPNALENFPLDVYDDDDCYEMAMLTGSPQVYSWHMNKNIYFCGDWICGKLFGTIYTGLFLNNQTMSWTVYCITVFHM